MSSSTLITLEKIETLAGARRYELGLANSQTIPIKEFSLTANAASANIEGYTTTLRFRNDTVEGACNCPESDGFEFCEHCVQLALHTQKVSLQMLSLSKGPDKSRILSYLLSLDKQDLAKQMLVLLEQDKEQFQKYLLKASLVKETFDWKELRKELTQITKPQKGLFSQRQVKAYFGKIEDFLEVLSEGQPFGSVESFLKLLEYAVKRINGLLDKMEDRHEMRNGALEILRGLFQESLASSTLNAQKTAAYVLELWAADVHQVLGKDPERFLHHHPTALPSFQSLAEAQWHELKIALQAVDDDLSASETSKGMAQRERKQQFFKTLARYLLQKVERGDSELNPYDLRETLLETEEDYLQLAAMLVEACEPQRATTLLEQALIRWPQSDRSAIAMFNLLVNTERLNPTASEPRTNKQGSASPGPAIDEDTDQDMTGFDPIFALYQRFPVALGDALFDYLFDYTDEQSSRDRAQQKLVEFLLAERPEGADVHLLRALLQLNKVEAIQRLYPSMSIVDEDQIALAPKVFKALPELGLDMYREQIQRLLQKRMLSADKRAAQLTHQLEGLCDAYDIEFDQTAHWVRSEVRGRNSFLETYRQLSRNAVLF